jgi:hypothetical protein
MIIGQSAGVIASQAAKGKQNVHELPYVKIRERLLAQGQVLTLPDLKKTEPPGDFGASLETKTLPGIVLDDRAAKFAGPWAHSTNFKPHVGNGYQHDEKQGDGKSSATFRFAAPQGGRYEVLMAYSAHPSRAKNVPMTISSGDKTAKLVVDQTQPLPQGQMFRAVGSVDITPNVETVITISNHETEGFVIVDALQLLPVK